jgi:hypothetical protein
LASPPNQENRHERDHSEADGQDRTAGRQSDRPIAAQIDSLMAGGASGVTEKLGGLMQSVGGMFGKK